MSETEQEKTLAAREIARLLSDFRKEYLDRLANSVRSARDDVAKSGYDPAAGSGRGPWWANGG
ncbi:MAG: hypothetical protein JRE57_00215 [Deltaproteobacteria bacterium]|nr:hypothetical protein [Deltaproteobacteria bacterium]